MLFLSKLVCRKKYSIAFNYVMSGISVQLKETYKQLLSSCFLLSNLLRSTSVSCGLLETGVFL